MIGGFAAELVDGAGAGGRATVRVSVLKNLIPTPLQYLLSAETQGYLNGLARGQFE